MNRWPIVLDGGNIIMNSRYLLATRTILDDNPFHTEGELRASLENITGRKLVLLQHELEDPTGHADGLVRFLHENVLLVNDLEAIAPELWQTNSSVLASLDCAIVRLPYSPSNAIINGWPVTTGNFIGFAATRTAIALPAGGHQDDLAGATDVIRMHDPLQRPIHFVSARPLDELGGSVHCVTWHH